MHTLAGKELVRMRTVDLELWKDEERIAQDELWLRIAKHIDPEVRRDIVGWMAGRDESPTLAQKWALKDALRDYLHGAACVMNPFPTTDPVETKSDRELIREDAQAVLGDMKLVALLIKALMDQKGEGRVRGKATV